VDICLLSRPVTKSEVIFKSSLSNEIPETSFEFKTFLIAKVAELRFQTGKLACITYCDIQSIKTS